MYCFRQHKRRLDNCKSKRINYKIKIIIKNFIRIACTNNRDEILSLNIILLSCTYNNM